MMVLACTSRATCTLLDIVSCVTSRFIGWNRRMCDRVRQRSEKDETEGDLNDHCACR